MIKQAIINSAFFGVFLSLFALQIGLFIKKKLKFGLFNPLLISIVFIIAILYFFDIPYEKFQKTSEHISFLLTPITICLAIALYEQISTLKNNFLAIMIGIFGGVFSGLCSIFVLAFLFGYDHQLYVTLLPKGITAPIGMGLSHELGGVVTLSVACIIYSGIFGNILGETLLKIFRITKPIAKGIALGTSSHIMGTAKAIELGDVEGAMASLSVAVAGLMTVVGASIFAKFI